MNIIDQLKEVVSLNWTDEDYGQSKHKADYKKQLSNIYQLDSFNYIEHNKTKILITESEVMYIADRNGEQKKFISCSSVKIKTNGEPTVTYKTTFPTFAKMVIDYLMGRYVVFDNRIYDINNRQAKLIDEITLARLYGFKNDIGYVVDILKGIDKHFHVEPVRKLELYKIAGEDFIIDLEAHTVTRTTIGNRRSFFKYYPVGYEQAIKSKEVAKDFLNYVIDDPDSLHNALLQTYYMVQVASGLKSKTNFFVTKSGVRTGKGLRHIALSGLLNKIDVELDSLTAGGFEASNAWATFSGGEMALATEQGDILGDKMERVLKIIATEKTHLGRNVGGNQGLVYLTSVLCIDTNRNVSLSDEMNGRKVLIQYKDRPKGETDLEREQAFEKYWETFTGQDKEPKIEGCIGFLLASLDYFKGQGEKFIWKDVEVYNGNEDLDDFQMYLINELQLSKYVVRSNENGLINIYKTTYGNNTVKAGKALQTIGVKSTKKKINGEVMTIYRIANKKRFNSFIPHEEVEVKKLSLFEDDPFL
ncbi:phage resistance protein [Streptococcus sp. GS001]|uniref:phage resistance protein n=1 Tax=Streptococcus sp. GS001 TaxID=2766953 RepID=UPI001F1F48BB|nr:phage resistance protein [Streptococcus sp. GS001]